MNIFRYKPDGGEHGLQLIAGKRKKPIPPPIRADEAREMWRMYRTGRSVPAIRIARRLPEIHDDDIVDELVGHSYELGFAEGKKAVEAQRAIATASQPYKHGFVEGIKAASSSGHPTPPKPLLMARRMAA